MKIKSQITLATLLVAGMFATGCQQMQQVAGAGQQQAAAPAETAPATTAPAATGDTHTHADAPDCATKTHSHKFTDPNHKHVYGCVAGQRPAVPKVKAKGNYKGPVAMDAGSKEVMQQYQQK